MFHTTLRIICRLVIKSDSKLLCHWLVFTQVGSGWIILDRRWSTEWRALSRWIFVCSACSTVRCQRAVTRTTTVPVTRRASSTLTPHHSAPTRPTLSPTAPGPGGVRSSATSSKPSVGLVMQSTTLHCVAHLDVHLLCEQLHYSVVTFNRRCKKFKKNVQKEFFKTLKMSKRANNIPLNASAWCLSPRESSLTRSAYLTDEIICVN